MDFKQFVQDNRLKIMEVLDSERIDIVNSIPIKTLISKYLQPFWRDRPNKQAFYMIKIHEEHALKVSYAGVEDELPTAIKEVLKTHNCLTVNAEFQIVDAESVKITEELLINESKKDLVVFFFGDKGTELVVRGKQIEKVHTFYTEEDKAKYLEKYHISAIEDCLVDFENSYLKRAGVNPLFFATRATVNRIEANCTKKNILRNKPESVFRDSLEHYLNDKTQHTFTKENELDSQRELDLYTEADGKNYLIEVKWLGQAVKTDESEFTSPMTGYHAKHGVLQTVQYVQELIVRMNFNLHCGFLCVFDARENKSPINYDNHNLIYRDNQELIPFFEHHFKKLKEIKVDNITLR